MAAQDRALERKRLTDLHEKATDAFDRSVMTLAGGALGISLAFVHDVAPKPRHVWVMGVSWLLFALSLLLILVSFLTSERAVVSMVDKYDRSEEIERGKWTDYLNWGAAAALIIGVVLLVIFAWLNL
jgi:uncharacterized BrkB/YihY/UPF0761 family membrane protein